MLHSTTRELPAPPARRHLFLLPLLKFRLVELFGGAFMKLASVCALLSAGLLSLAAQSINSGTVTGVVADPSGAVIAGAHVQMRNPVTGYNHTTTTDSSGDFRFNNVPPNNYELMVSATGFATASQPVQVHSSVPVNLNISLAVASEVTTV